MSKSVVECKRVFNIKLWVIYGRAIAQAVSSWLLTADTRACGGFVLNKVTLGQVFLRVLRFSPVNIISLLLHIHSCIIWGMDNRPVSGRSSTKTVSPCRNHKQ
jgi:hypothetical protein